MCGIIGYFSEGGISRDSLFEALSALDRIKHRGPDGSGAVLIDTKTGNFKTLRTPNHPADLPCDISFEAYEDRSFDLFLGHRRLSILDLSSLGHQPMKDSAGNWMAFNGEVYNFLELREDLKAKGYSFQTGTDTEVLMAAFREFGNSTISRFNGMWAFLFWDNQKKELLVSKDRFNVKPLYFFQNEKEFAFASEIKSLLAFNDRHGKLDYGNMNVFLEWGIIDFDDSTFFENIHRFPAANYWHFNPSDFVKNRKKAEKYWNLPAHTLKISDKDAIEQYRYLLDDSIRLRLRSDVEWGLTLSGGLDSSTIAYASHRQAGGISGIKSFSAIFKNMEGDESEFIEKVRDDLGLDSRYINPMDIFSTEKLVENIYYYDFPSLGTSYFSEYAVMSLAKEAGIKVLLEGQGGDEIFAGYHHHFFRFVRENFLKFKFYNMYKNAGPWAEKKGFSKAKVWNSLKSDFKYKLLDTVKKDKEGIRNQWMESNTLRGFLEKDFFNFSLPGYLRSSDRDSMAFGIESRTPLLDYRMVEFGFTLPNDLKIRDGWQKYIMRVGSQNMHPSIQWRKDKKGFTTPDKFWVDSNKRDWGGFFQNLVDYGISKPNENWATDKVFRAFSLGVWLQLMSKLTKPQIDLGSVFISKEVVKKNEERKQRICVSCVMSPVHDPDIVFDEFGVCNYCKKYEREKAFFEVSPEIKLSRVEEIVSRIKQKGKGKKYDCILGISGGVDSSYLAWEANRLGLRPLCVHFDNGWNSELAVKNIQSLLETLNFDLDTYVVNWEEFKDLQLSYIKAGVVDWEIPTDHGFFACLHLLAWKHKIPTVLTGHNYQTEAILPPHMRWSKFDAANILAIHAAFGKRPLETFPILSFWRYTWIQRFLNVEQVPLLNYLGYHKFEAKQLLIDKMGWRPYGGKHYESVFTRFYQGYVLPERFGIDKRSIHLSTLVHSGLMTRDEALEELKQTPYPPEVFAEDYPFVLKKLGLSEEEFQTYMKQPIHSHLDFKSYETGLYPKHQKFFAFFRPLTRVVKKISGKPLLSDSGI